MSPARKNLNSHAADTIDRSACLVNPAAPLAGQISRREFGPADAVIAVSAGGKEPDETKARVLQKRGLSTFQANRFAKIAANPDVAEKVTSDYQVGLVAATQEEVLRRIREKERKTLQKEASPGGESISTMRGKPSRIYHRGQSTVRRPRKPFILLASIKRPVSPLVPK